MTKPTVLLADDHKIMAEGLCALLQDDFDLVGLATNGREMVELTLTMSPDIVITDVSMPLLNGIDALQKLRQRGCEAHVIFLTMHADAGYAARALRSGAAGYVLKQSAADELIEAIRIVLGGGRYISAALRTDGWDDQTASDQQAVEVLELTSRQRQIVQLLSEGKSAKQIGALLSISPRTVETHKYKLMSDLGVKTAAELVQYAIRHALV